MNRLDKIEARTNAATEGPWEWDGESNEPWPAGDNSLRSVSGAKDDLVLYAWGYDAYGIEAARDADAEFIAHARADVPDMAAALRAVLEVHQDGGESQGYLDDGHYGDIPHCCTECGSLGEYGVPWPCATVTAIRQHIGDDL